MKNLFNEDYFERGVELGISCYSNYRWIPELTIPLAHRIINYLDINYNDRILDFGCAKGYLVKAFNLLGYECYGYDISAYAIENCPKDIYHLLSRNLDYFLDENLDWTISKDVLEHIDYSDIDNTLQDIRLMSENVFVIVPLGENEKYNINTYEMDNTHIIREPIEWWENKFEKNGLKIISKAYKVKGIKENWNNYEKGNGFFVLKNE